MQHLDTTDLDRLEAALDAAPPGTLARVVTDGQTYLLHRVNGGWHLPGDVVIASGDVADGRPSAVTLLDADDRRRGDEEGLMLLAEIHPQDAADVRAWRDALLPGEDDQ
jgi:hypothetical protein